MYIFVQAAFRLPKTGGEPKNVASSKKPLIIGIRMREELRISIQIPSTKAIQAIYWQ